MTRGLSAPDQYRHGHRRVRRPPAGRPFRSWAVDILGFRDGRIISNWTGADWPGLFVQLGAIDNPWI
jgi:hypothetical protein